MRRFRETWRQAIRESDLLYLFIRSPAAMIASGFLSVILLAVIMAPWIAPTNPYDLRTFDVLDSLLPPVWSPGGDPRFLFGTDDQGRDLLSSILYGARLSITIGVTAVVFAIVLGVGLGLTAGYVGGRFDMVVMRIADIQLSLPAILTALLVDGVARGILPREAHDQLMFFVLVIAIGLSLWVNFARTARASTFVERNKEYVQAAEIMGLAPWRVMLTHILPNILGPLLVIMTVDLAVAVLLEATLSFLGIGVPANQPSLGTLIRIGTGYMFSGEWWVVLIPSCALIALIVSVN
ncbi:MAG: ABC transporter permease, partial [Hyphomicrobiaceae bacterium]